MTRAQRIAVVTHRQSRRAYTRWRLAGRPFAKQPGAIEHAGRLLLAGAKLDTIDALIVAGAVRELRAHRDRALGLPDCVRTRLGVPWVDHP